MLPAPGPGRSWDGPGTLRGLLRRLIAVMSQPASASNPPSSAAGAPLTVRAITAAEHTEFLARHPLTSVLPNPSWA